MAARKALLFQVDPAIAALASVFFEINFAAFALAKARHRGKLLLDELKKVKNGLTAMRQVHLRTEAHVDIEVFAESSIRIGHVYSVNAPKRSRSPSLVIGLLPGRDQPIVSTTKLRMGKFVEQFVRAAVTFDL